MQWLRISLALAVVALVYFYRLDQPTLWGDEADTGIFARSVLRTGVPLTYDSRNVSIYDNGAQLNKNLLSKKIPWAQYYLGAASLALFGNTTAGLRVLFAFIGLLAFFPIWAVLKRRVPFPEAITALALLAPQVVLFQRNARYYSILILLYAVLVWGISSEFKSRKFQLLIASTVFVLLFHTHPVAAACSGVSLVLYCLLAERKSLAVYSTAVAIGFFAWLVWYISLGPALGEKAVVASLLASDFGEWVKVFSIGLVAAVFDLDTVGCLPVIAWLLVAGFLIQRNGKAAIEIFKRPLPCFVLLNLLVQVVATAAIFGYDTANKHSMLRYEPHLLVFGVVAWFVLLDAAFISSAKQPPAAPQGQPTRLALRAIYLATCTCLIATNLLTVSFWYHPFPREVPISWVPPVYGEVFHPPENVWEAIFAKIKSEAESSMNRDAVVVASPSWTDEIVIFYLGDYCLVPPVFDPPCIECEKTIVRLLGEEAYRRLAAPPTWGLDMLGLVEQLPPGATVAATFPTLRARPDDGSRPELTRHTFAQEKPVGNVTLYRLPQR